MKRLLARLRAWWARETSYKGYQGSAPKGSISSMKASKGAGVNRASVSEDDGSP